MAANLKELVEKLIDMNAGDSVRLGYILNFLEKGRTLYTSDRKYVEGLITKYLPSELNSETINEVKQAEFQTRKERSSARLDFFRTPPLSQDLVDGALLAARLGMAFVFISPGLNHALSPEKLGHGLQMITNFSPMLATNIAFLLGVGEIISGILIALGLITRINGLFQIFILVGAMIMFGFDFSKGPAIWKDPGLLGLSIVFTLYGPGRLSLDYLIYKHIKQIN
ncbi:MAG: DoxX family protein [Thaumarchaeota archaeon]|nr:DoxX family protein [Nitrososphaerota archaeon]